MKYFNKKLTVSILLLFVIVGIGGTFALSIAKTGPVVNLFKAADHDTNIKEEIDGLTKTVQVTNSAKDSPAFIRIRFEISPDQIGSDMTIDLVDNSWVYGNDGFYYYTKAVKSQEDTGEIKASVDPEKINVDTFDILVYEESCVANIAAGQSADVADIQEAFAQAAG